MSSNDNAVAKAAEVEDLNVNGKGKFVRKIDDKGNTKTFNLDSLTNTRTEGGKRGGIHLVSDGVVNPSNGDEQFLPSNPKPKVSSPSSEVKNNVISGNSEPEDLLSLSQWIDLSAKTNNLNATDNSWRYSEIYNAKKNNNSQKRKDWWSGLGAPSLGGITSSDIDAVLESNRHKLMVDRGWEKWRDEKDRGDLTNQKFPFQTLNYDGILEEFDNRAIGEEGKEKGGADAFDVKGTG